MCSYHGWEFEGDGSCSRIPQADSLEAEATAMASKRSCVEWHPVQARCRYARTRARHRLACTSYASPKSDHPFAMCFLITMLLASWPIRSVTDCCLCGARRGPLPRSRPREAPSPWFPSSTTLKLPPNTTSSATGSPAFFLTGDSLILSLQAVY